MKNNASLVYNVTLVVGDFFALLLAFVIAYVVRIKLQIGLDQRLLGPVPSRSYIIAFLAVLPFCVLIFALLGLYNSSIYEKRFRELGRLLVGSFVGLLFVVFWNFVAARPIFPARLIPFYGFAFGFVFLVVFRNLARFARARLFSYNIGITNVVITGNTPITKELLSSLVDSRRSGYRVVAVVGAKRYGDMYGVPSFKHFSEFLQAGVPEELHGIIQTELYLDEQRNTEILEYAQEHHIGYRFVPGNSELFVGNLEVELFRSSVPVITVHQTALFGWGRVAKRLMDLVVAVPALVVAAPIMLLITLAMKLAEPGAPLLYKPHRLGRFGRLIPVYKFRSMYQAYTDMSPEEGFAKMGRPELAKQFREGGDQLPRDPRVTPIGRFLRRTSLDELPQLFNIIRGDISLVGPRALDPFELEKYPKKNLILTVKTGLTGLAQVSGRRDISFDERRKLDLYYVQNWSLWLDLTILLKTIRVVLGRRGTN